MTLEMTYDPVRTTQLRAIWNVHVKVNDLLAYDFAMDAVTGDNYSVAKRIYHKAESQTTKNGGKGLGRGF